MDSEKVRFEYVERIYNSIQPYMEEYKALYEELIRYLSSLNAHYREINDRVKSLKQKNPLFMRSRLKTLTSNDQEKIENTKIALLKNIDRLQALKLIDPDPNNNLINSEKAKKIEIFSEAAYEKGLTRALKLLIDASRFVNQEELYHMKEYAKSQELLAEKVNILLHDYKERIIEKGINTYRKLLKTTQFSSMKRRENNSKLNILIITGVGSGSSDISYFQDVLNSSTYEKYSSYCNFNIFDYDSKGIFSDVFDVVHDKVGLIKTDRVERLVSLLMKMLDTDSEIVILCYSHGVLLTYRAIQFLKNNPKYKEALKEVSIKAFGGAQIIPEKTKKYQLKEALNYFNSTDLVNLLNFKANFFKIFEGTSKTPYNIIFQKEFDNSIYKFFVYDTSHVKNTQVGEKDRFLGIPVKGVADRFAAHTLLFNFVLNKAMEECMQRSKLGLRSRSRKV